MQKPNFMQLLSESESFKEAYEKYQTWKASLSPEELAEYERECEEERRAQEEQDRVNRAYATRKARRARMDVPPMFEEAKVTDCDAKVQAYTKELLKGSSKSAILRGPVGTGKTTAACAILNRLVDDRACKFVTLYRFKRLMDDGYFDKSRSRQEIFAEYAYVDILVIDDLGQELKQATSNMVMTFLDLINDRMTYHRPTIFTTQYDGAQLFKMLSESPAGADMARAILDRLKMCVSIPFEGESMREKAQLELDF